MLTRLKTMAAIASQTGKRRYVPHNFGTQDAEALAWAVAQLERRTVWILSSGSGEDGDEWDLRGVYLTEADAIAARDRRATGDLRYGSNEPREIEIGEDT